MLLKLFNKITYAQRNELLKTEAAFSNIYEPITFQEAERRILRDGEIAFALSQEDEATSVLPASTHSPMLNTVPNNQGTSPRNMADTSPGLGLLLLKVGSLFPLLPDFSC